MTRLAPLLAALLLAAPAVAQDQAAPAAAQDQAAPAASAPADAAKSPAVPNEFDLARSKITNCQGEKFVFAWGAGAHPTKVTLCSEKDAGPQEVIRMLDEAAAKIEQTKGIAEDRRTAIVQQIRAKIAELQLRRPLKSRSAEVAEPAPPPGLISALPPLPAPPRAASRPAVVTRLVPRPKLSFTCMSTGEFAAGGACVTLTRDTIITLKAGEAIANGFSLRFNRQGDDRAEVDLGSMRKGQSIRLSLPQRVCSGVVTSEVEMRITNGGRTVGTEGPFLLRC